jgi:hypothetical protein
VNLFCILRQANAINANMTIALSEPTDIPAISPLVSIGWVLPVEVGSGGDTVEVGSGGVVTGFVLFEQFA